jgi:hypothetical protein
MLPTYFKEATSSAESNCLARKRLASPVSC